MEDGKLLDAERVVLEQLKHVLEMEEGELWLHECKLRDHDPVLVVCGTLSKVRWHTEFGPVLWLFGECMNDRNSDLIACCDLLEVGLSTLSIGA